MKTTRILRHSQATVLAPSPSPPQQDMKFENSPCLLARTIVQSGVPYFYICTDSLAASYRSSVPTGNAVIEAWIDMLTSHIINFNLATTAVRMGIALSHTQPRCWHEKIKGLETQD